MITIKIDNSKKVNGEWSLFVSFPYDNKIVSVIRELPSRFWYPDEKEWEVPIKKLGYLVDSLQGYEFDISGQYVSLASKTTNIPSNFHFKTNP